MIIEVFDERGQRTLDASAEAPDDNTRADLLAFFLRHRERADPGFLFQTPAKEQASYAYLLLTMLSGPLAARWPVSVRDRIEALATSISPYQGFVLLRRDAERGFVIILCGPHIPTLACVSTT